MHSNVLIKKEINKIEIEGRCRGFQTELDFVEKNGILFPIDTGKIVSGTEWEARNTLQTGLLYYLPHKLDDDATANRALDDLFISNGTKASVGAANDGKDGVAHGIIGPVTIDYILQTTLNSGGTEAEAYIEWYAFITGSATLSQQLILGHNYSNSGEDFETDFSYTSISQTVAADRRYHHYWKFTFAEA
jgi:hypothetical protein